MPLLSFSLSTTTQLLHISGDLVNVDLMSLDGHLDWSRKTWQPSLFLSIAHNHDLIPTLSFSLIRDRLSN